MKVRRGTDTAKNEHYKQAVTQRLCRHDRSRFTLKS
ncbi:hypothetical protein MAXJ12_20845 [Mesorhizobium alhagi CCNWXJ12-2]|uniref:Uncharacterized protein n=1 Tax=Mesorhizobium alhagi CCNWXJ12-2 TaxID=1107882 RepID=H0HVG2_9HYPH|nr:hypothetical protein MAXJ12_20845 [Mesorhizobium alhagi CCNWXJ12-2]